MAMDDQTTGTRAEEPGASLGGTGDEPTTSRDVDETAPAAEAPGGGRRLLAAVLTLPWLLGYGVLGAWAVALALRALADGTAKVGAGYVHPVRPGALLVVGILLLVAFATLLATALLVLWGSRRGGRWLAVAVVAWMLTAGAVWAALAGGLSLGLWLLYFFGLAYAAVLATVTAARVTRGPGRGRIAAP
jgi:hypothetical protein